MWEALKASLPSSACSWSLGRSDEAPKRLSTLLPVVLSTSLAFIVSHGRPTARMQAAGCWAAPASYANFSRLGRLM